MNSAEDPYMSYECDLTAQRDALRGQVATLRAALSGLLHCAEGTEALYTDHLVRAGKEWDCREPGDFAVARAALAATK